MMNDKTNYPAIDLLNEFCNSYEDVVKEGFNKRMEQITPQIYEQFITETICALLSRQATLSIEMVRSPSLWNVHSAPLFLRCMVDAYITLAWILDSPTERSKKFVEYGLGQEKLVIEYLTEGLKIIEDESEKQPIQDVIDRKSKWLNRQLADWATEVNVGSWSGTSVRDMAKEIGRESIYQHAYVPFSGAIHNMWQHISVFNTKQCINPLHKYHLMPAICDFPIDPDFMYRSAKYISLAYDIFDLKMNVKCDVVSPERFLIEHEFFSGVAEGSTNTGVST